MKTSTFLSGLTAMHTTGTAELPNNRGGRRQRYWVHAPLVGAILLAVAYATTTFSAVGQQAGPGLGPGEIVRDCPDCGELVVVPTGSFDTGSNDVPYERPVHRVAIRTSFAIGRRAVTSDEWDACVSASGCKHRPDDRGWGRGQHPVIDVSWDDAQAFAFWLSQKTGKRYRLPTEAEWEYAARGGTPSPFWWGCEIGGNNANCEDCLANPPRRTQPVGSFRPNGFGLYDTSGKVAEWVQDCWSDNYRGASKDGAAWMTDPCAQRVLRGGSFASRSSMVRSHSRLQVRS
jgi:formylglycine-generating enzyme required for sulfatase activity